MKTWLFSQLSDIKTSNIRNLKKVGFTENINVNIGQSRRCSEHLYPKGISLSKVKMASDDTTVRQFHKQFKDITECCICTETYKDPRILPCIHTFCLRCLETAGLKSAKKPGCIIPCPICRKEFTIPDDGFIGIQKNFFMMKLIEMSMIFNESTTTCKCDACLEDSNPDSASEVPLAEKFCKDCCLKLCKNCSTHHGKNKLTKNHELISVDSETSKEELINNLMPEMCHKHVEERFKIYCTDCKDIVCAYCYIDSHQSHKWLETDRAAEEFRKDIQTNIHSLQSRISETTAKKKELEDATNESIEKVKFLEKSVIERTNELKAVIDKHSKSLLAELDIIKQRRLKEIKNDIEDIDEEIMNLDSYTLYCEEITKRGSSSDICRMISGIIARSSDLKKTQEATIQLEISPFNTYIDFTSSDAFLRDDGRNIIGKTHECEKESEAVLKEDARNVISKMEDTSIGNCTREIISESEKSTIFQKVEKSSIELPHGGVRNTVEMTPSMEETTTKRTSSLKDEETSNAYKKPILLHKISSMGAGGIKRNSPISGLAIIEKELFITTESSSTVEVYDSLSFMYKRFLSLPQLQNPGHMVAALGSSNCLFICNDGKISQVTTDGVVTSSWFSGKKDIRLSITSESNVLVSFMNENYLKEYMNDWRDSVKRLVQQTNPKVRCTYAVKLDSGQFIICRGCTGDVCSSPGVYQLDKEGKILKSFHGKRESAVESLKDPSQLIVSKAGTIIVLDRGTRQVFLLDSNLKYQKELIGAQDGLQNPRSMVLDQSTDRLFISDHDNATVSWRILVFRI